MTKTAQKKYDVLGSNDDAAHCECCGRTGLRRVVWMQQLDEDGVEIGDPIPFGRVCAAKAAGWTYGTTGDLDRKIAKLSVETQEKYRKLCFAAMDALEAEGKIVRTRVAYSLDVKSGFHRKGLIYALPGDVIETMSDAEQVKAIGEAKDRRNAAYPVCRVLDQALSTVELHAILHGQG